MESIADAAADRRGDETVSKGKDKDPKTKSPPRTKTPPDVSEIKPTTQQHQSPPKAEIDTDDTATIEVDSRHNYDSESDAGYGTDEAGSTASTSISSSIRDYAFENNRRYHKYQEGRYQFPNDEPEQEREDMKHSMIVNLCEGRLHFAPLHNPQRILDVGTGTGIWATDMGDEYPEADVQGIDLSPIQPQWVPPNVHFILDDAEAEWVYPENSLDYIHLRHMTSSIRDWPLLVSRAYEALAPGGWIEMQELMFDLRCDDDSVRPGNLVAGFFDNMKRGLESFGVDLLSMRKNQQFLTDAGFVHVQEVPRKVPVGVWPKGQKMKTIGLYNRSMIYDALSGVSIKPFKHGLKWSQEEIELYLVGVRKDLMDSSQHGYIPFHVVIGQKPE